ncbi:hypothetical protein K8R14_00555 [bacterium]|nr:hypothetical protein [bacterium]
MSKTKKHNINTVMVSIQRYCLYTLLAIIPIAILPFPWDFTEKGMSITILAFTIVIVALEVIKVLWSGKFVSLKRNTDIILFALFVSFLLTTVFAFDSNLSLFGFDYQFASGLVGVGSILILTFLLRSFILKKEDIAGVITAFLVGSVLASLLSLISIFGGNILGIFPRFSSLFSVGFPIIGAPVVLVIYNGISIILAKISLEILKDKKIKNSSWFSIIAIIINGISLLLFSIDPISLIISVVFLVIWVVISLIQLSKEKASTVKSRIMELLLPVTLVTAVLLIQIEAISDLILKHTEILSPLTLSSDVNWQIVSQSLMFSLKNGILGVGLDSFASVFTTLKPLVLTNVEFANGFNEILTSLSNGGFLWLIIWLVLGWYILKDLLHDVKTYKAKKKELVLFDAVLLFIFITSFITTYTTILRFAFFLIISLSVVMRSLISSEEVENLLLKIWAMGTGKKKGRNAPTVSIFITVITVLIALLLLFKLGSITLSSLYVLRAENYIIEENKKYVEVTPTLEQRSEFVDTLYNWYLQALKYDLGNPLVNRKFSLIAVDKMDITFSLYEEEEDEGLLDEIVILRNQAFEYSKTAINISPSLYSSYNNRALIYLGLVNLGYTDYIRDGLSAVNDAIDLKPTDYQNYFHMAQLYYLLEDYDSAFDASSQTISINGVYIPALIMSANISGIQENTEVQLAYLEAIKIILETDNLQDAQLYLDTVEQIEIIKGEESFTQEDLVDEDIDNEVSLETE